MKRFYKDTAVDTGDGGFRVLLDGRPMRTPAKTLLVVPTEPLAAAIAGEWQGIPEKAEINVSYLALTRLAATGLDRVCSARTRTGNRYSSGPASATVPSSRWPAA